MRQKREERDKKIPFMQRGRGASDRRGVFNIGFVLIKFKNISFLIFILILVLELPGEKKVKGVGGPLTILASNLKQLLPERASALFRALQFHDSLLVTSKSKEIASILGFLSILGFSASLYSVPNPSLLSLFTCSSSWPRKP